MTKGDLAEVEYDCSGWSSEQKEELTKRINVCAGVFVDDVEPELFRYDWKVSVRWAGDTLLAPEAYEATIDHVLWTMENYPGDLDTVEPDVYLGPLYERDRPQRRSFVQSVRHCIRNSFRMRGRASRSEYWKFVLVWVITGIVFGGVLGPIFSGILSDSKLDNSYSMIFVLPQLMLFPALVAVTIRRFHDAGFSGFWWFLPIGNYIILALPSEQQASKFGPPLRVDDQ